MYKMGGSRIKALADSISKNLPDMYEHGICIWAIPESSPISYLFLHRDGQGQEPFMRIYEKYRGFEIHVYDPFTDILDDAIRKGVEAAGYQVKHKPRRSSGISTTYYAD